MWINSRPQHETTHIRCSSFGQTLYTLHPTKLRKGFINTLRHSPGNRSDLASRPRGSFFDTLGGSNPSDSNSARLAALHSPGSTKGTLSLSIRPPSHAWYHN